MSSLQALFDFGHYQAAMRKTGRYRCAGNMLWADLKLAANLPTRLAQVKRVQSTYFGTCPKQFPQLVIVGVTDVAVNPITQWGHRGGLPRISPEEPLHALILAAKAAMDEGATEEVLAEWRSCILNTPFEFVKCESPRDLVWQRINARESYATEFDLFSRTVLGRIHEVWDVLLKLEQDRGGRTPAPALVAQAWQDNARLSGSSEPVTMSYVETALTVRRRVLSDTDSLKAIQRAEDLWGKATPWNSIYKLELLARKLGAHGDKKNLCWMVEGVEHMVLEGDLRPEECTVKALTGKSTNNRGILDLLLLKRGILQHLLFVTLPHLEYSPETLSRVQEAMRDHRAFRANFTKGRAWLGVMPLAIQKLVFLIANIVFGSQNNAALKTQLKSSTNVQEALEIPCLAEPLRELTDVASEARRSLDTPGGMVKATPGGLPQSAGGLPQSAVLCIDLEKLPGGLPQNPCSEAEQSLLNRYEKEAREIVDVGVDLALEQTSQAAMAACIGNTPVGKLRGTPHKNGGMILIFYNIRMAGETTTQPHLRLPPFRNDPDAPSGAHYKKMIMAVIASRRSPSQAQGEETDELHPGDCFVIGDAGRTGNTPQIMAAFKDERNGQPLSKSVKSLMVHYTEASMESRRAKIRGSLSLEQCEHFHFVSASGLKGLRRPRLHFPDLTTAGTALGPVALPTPDEKDTWKLKLKQKKALYGCARILPGGRAPGDDPESAADDDDREDQEDQPKD